MGGIAECESIKTASFDFDAQIIRYVKKEYNIEIGPLTAEEIKIKVGAAIKRDIEIAMVAKGRNIFSGLPESFEITSALEVSGSTAIFNSPSFVIVVPFSGKVKSFPSSITLIEYTVIGNVPE